MTHRPTRRERLQVIFAFLVFFGGAMFLVSPDPNRAQTLFRIALMIIGIVGIAGMNVRGTGG